MSPKAEALKYQPIPRDGRLKVIHVIDSLGRGGAENYLVDLLPALRDRGIDCSVVGLMRPYDLAPALEARGIPVHRIDLPHRWHAERALRGLLRVFRLVAPDVIHAHLYFSTIHVALTRPFAPRPCRVVQLHNLDYDIYPVDSPWRHVRRAVHQLALSRGMDARIAYSKAVADHYQLHLRPGPIDLVTLGVDANSVTRHPVVREEIRARHGVGPDEVWILLPGRFVRQKGHRVLVEALVRLRGRGIRPRVLMVGDGPMREEVRSLVLSDALGDQIAILPAVAREEIMKFYQSADIVAVPSTQEGFGLVILEAMLAQACVVGSAVGGIPEAIEDRVTGLLVPPGDPGALADTLAYVVADATARAGLAARAREQVLATHTLDMTADQFASLYRRICGSRAARVRTADVDA